MPLCVILFPFYCNFSRHFLSLMPLYCFWSIYSCFIAFKMKSNTFLCPFLPWSSKDMTLNSGRWTRCSTLRHLRPFCRTLFRTQTLVERKAKEVGETIIQWIIFSIFTPKSNSYDKNRDRRNKSYCVYVLEGVWHTIE